MIAEVGPVEIDVPRDTASSFEPQIVKKRQRRLTGDDEIVLSLTAKGLTAGEISAHFAEIYGASISNDTVSAITDKVVAEMTDYLDAGSSAISTSAHSVRSARVLTGWSQQVAIT